MKRYKIPISWTMIDFMTVEANSKEEAEQMAEQRFYSDGSDKYANAEYCQDSFVIDGEAEEVK